MEGLFRGRRTAPFDFAAEHLEQARDAGIPIGKQVHILKLVLDAARHFAIVQPHRDDVDFVERPTPHASPR